MSVATEGLGWLECSLLVDTCLVAEGRYQVGSGLNEAGWLTCV